MVQEVEAKVWEIFEKELKKTQDIKIELPVSFDNELNQFWDIFLNEELPKGSINQTLEKNFAIYIIKNKLDIEKIKAKYQAQGWNPSALLGWVKKVNAGEIIEFNIKELVNWTEKYKPELKELLQDEQDKLKYFSLKHLNRMKIEPIDWIARDLIPRGSIVVFAGKRGSFKSFSAISFSLSVASGKPFLDFFQTKKQKILYVDEENGIPILKERINKIKTGMGLKDTKELEESIFFTSFANVKLDSEIWRRKLERVIEKIKPDIVIIDSLRRVISFDENVAGEMSKLFTDVIRVLSEKYGLTWILLHHLRKGMSGRRNIADEMDEIRGSSDIANYSDVIVIFDRKKGTSDNLVLKQVKCRRAQEISPKLIQLESNDDNLKMVCVGDCEDTLFADELCSQMIMNWLAEEQKSSFATKEVLEAMKEQKQSRASVYRALNILQEGDKPKIRKSGTRGHYQLNVEIDLEKFKKQEKKSENDKK